MSELAQPSEGKTFIATYGSLRTGQSNFRVNERGGGVSIGLGKTKDKYDLFRYHGCYFPSISLKHSANEIPVVVEVFEAPETGLTGAYDSLEGYPNFYNRTQIQIEMDDGRSLMAWIYHIDESQEETVTHGDWAKFLAEKG